MNTGLGQNPQCIAQTASDRQCKNTARSGSEYCERHSPELAEKRSEAAKRAAQTRTTTTLTLSAEMAHVKDQLRNLNRDLLAGNVLPPVGTVSVQIHNALLRAIEIERKVVELEEAIPMLEEIKEEMKREKEAGRQRGQRWGA